MMMKLCLMFGYFAISDGSEEFEAFLQDVIQTWQLRSPTIIFKEDLPKMCMQNQRLLCLSNEGDRNELANHLASIHQHRKQDGLIFVGQQGHTELLKHLSRSEPSLLTSNYPVFMPSSYKNDVRLRLDSNILFYTEINITEYEIHDIFAVKAGPSIALDVGLWEFDKGIRLKTRLNRWDRRTDLQQSTIVNCLRHNPPWAQYTKDKNGNTIGAKGYYQDILFYITDKLNMTTEIMDATGKIQLLDNGSWTGEIGSLQRREADVVSRGLGINLHRSSFIDYPYATFRQPMTLIAAIQKGVSTDVWVYVEVFGFSQWMIFIALLILMVIGLSVIHAMSYDGSAREFGIKRDSTKTYEIKFTFAAMSMVFMYTIQKGSHTNSKKLASRLLTFTISILTLLIFAFYTTNITAEMTSGPSGIPINTFEDVVHHNYKVVTYSHYFENILASSKPGSAKHEVFNSLFEFKSNEEALNAVIEDPDKKTLLYANPLRLLPTTPSERILTNQVFALKMDDSVYAIGGLALQKDSEFVDIFNHYILKSFEVGEFRRVHRTYFMDLYTKENFEVIQPQSLGLNNVMFCFTCLGFGICISLISAMAEFMKMKIN